MPLNSAVAATVAEKIVSILKVPAEAKNDTVDNWAQIVGAIFDSITQNGIVVPTTMVAPPGAAGGPVTGVGKIQ